MLAKYPKETVVAYIKAIDTQDYEGARKLLEDNARITGPGEAVESPDGLIEALKSTGSKLNVKKMLAEGSDVCVLIQLTTTKPPVSVSMSSWYKVSDGKIASIQSVFDTSPFREAGK